MNPGGIQAFGLLAGGRGAADGIETAVGGIPLTAYWNASYPDDYTLVSGQADVWNEHGVETPVYPWDYNGAVLGSLDYDDDGWDGQAEFVAPDATSHALQNEHIQGFLATGSWAMLIAMNVPAQLATNRVIFSNCYTPNQYLAIDYPSSTPPYVYWRRNGVSKQGSVARTVGRVVYLWRYDGDTGAFTWDELSAAGWQTLVSGSFTPGDIAPGGYAQINNFAPGGTYQPKDSVRIIALWGVTIPSVAQLRAGGEWIANGLGCPVT